MAKKRFNRFRRRARSFAGFMRRRAGSVSRRGLGMAKDIVQPDAVAYGVARPYVASVISPLTSMLPLGQYSDEVGMAILNYLIASNTSGFVSSAARKGIIVENAMVGSQAGANFGLGGASKSVSSSRAMYG